MRIRLRRNRERAAGFTLVELLTALAVVAVLLALIVPAFNLITKQALNVRQKGQFNRIEVALEAFRTDFGDYPRSRPNSRYYGAQMLAEAIVGWDGFGFHPNSVFSYDGTNNPAGGGTRVYADPTSPSPGETWDQNVKARKGPYLELEAAGAVRLTNMELYRPNVTQPSTQWPAAATYVLADSFGKVTHAKTKKKTGMPILYYKANTSGTLHPMDDANVADNDPMWAQCVFDIRDNQAFFAYQPYTLSGTQVPSESWYRRTNWYKFYEMTANPDHLNEAVPRLSRPYRSESFILQSAGPDGLYGTPDDVFNFESQ